MPAKKTSKRELIKPHGGDTRYIRRSGSGQFTDKQAEVGRSLSRDKKSKAKRTVPKGQGDRGDQRKSK